MGGHMKKYLIGILCVSWVSLCSAQDLFWSFDDSQTPLPIPAECDAKFDEIRGGVFMPTIDEMYDYGMAFIKNSAISVQQQGAYCLLGAALQGHSDAQFEIAKLYEGGRVLPQSDLNAYKWAFISALNGNKAAEKMTLILEQFLTTKDLELTSGAIGDTRIQIQQNLQQRLEEEKQKLQENKAKLNQMHSEIRREYLNQKNLKKANLPAPQLTEDEMEEEELPTPVSESKRLSNGAPTPEALQEPNSELLPIFTEEDRMQ